MQTTKKFLIAGAAALTLVAGGGAAFAASQSAPESAPAAAPGAPKVTAQQAIEIALKEVPGSWVSEVDLDGDARADVWEVKTVKGDVEYELDIHAGSGKLLKRESEPVDDD